LAPAREELLDREEDREELLERDDDRDGLEGVLLADELDDDELQQPHG
jgi:hypothetical protein